MHPYSYSPASRPPIVSSASSARSFKRTIGVFMFLLAMIGAWHVFNPQKSSAQTHPVALRTSVQQQQALATMSAQINTFIAANPDIDIAVTVTDIHKGGTLNFGSDVPFEAASVAKLITAADYLQQTEQGKQYLSQKLEDGHTAIYDLRQMVVKSDNSAWQSLNDQLGIDNLAVYANSIGISDYNLDNNSLRTEDIALLLTRLYSGNLLSSRYRNLLLSYMKQANEADLIPPMIPSDAKVYHKAGLLDDRVHDAAIIDDSQTPVVLVIFTNGHGTYGFPQRTQLLQSITKAVLTGYGIH